MGLVIAIDGPSGAGKSTVARQLAEHLGFTYIDTGAMYRALALWAIRSNLDFTDMHRMEQLAEAAQIVLHPESSRVSLNGQDVSDAIRTPEVSEAASQVASQTAVRRIMVAKQRSMGEQTNVVMEGRDIGTVVFPQAQVKVFLDAGPQERARRRADQLGSTAQESAVAQQMADRDARDRTRTEAPLTQAPDAIYLDSTQFSVQEVVQELLRVVRAKTTNGKSYC